MTNPIELLEQRQLRSDLPQFKAGDTVRVHFQVIEGQRRRVQVFEGIVIKRQGPGVRETFTVRKQSFGVGVERTFPVHSPKIEKIEVQAIGDVNRAKLYYLRAKVGKKARVREVQRGPAVSSPRVADERRSPEKSPQPMSPLPKKLSGMSPQQKSRWQTSKTAQRLLRFDRKLGARFVAGADEAGRGSLAGPLVVAGRPAGLRVPSRSSRPAAQLPERLEAGEPGAARGALPRRARLRDADLGADDLAGGDRPRGACTARTSRACGGRCMRLPRRPRPASSTASGSGRALRSTWRSSTATSGAPRSQRPRSWPRSSATGRCAGSTRSTRAMASPRTSATSRPVTPGSCASAGPCEIHRRSFQALCYLSEEELARVTAA